MDLVLVGVALGRVRQVDAVAVDVELPAVVDAAQAVFLVAAEEHRRAAVGAVGVDQADACRCVSRKAMRSSPRTLDAHGHAVRARAAPRTRATGSQKRRKSSPIGVPRLVLVTSSLSSTDSI